MFGHALGYLPGEQHLILKISEDLVLTKIVPFNLISH